MIMRKQRGFTMLELLIGIVVGAIISIVLLNALQGNRAETEMNEGTSFIVSDVSAALTSYFIGNARTYTGIPTGTTSSTYMNQRFGVALDLPWVSNLIAAPAWQFTASSPTTMTAQFSCLNTRTATECNTIASNILAMNAGMIGTSTAAVSATTSGCPSTGSTCLIQIQYTIPK